MSTKTKPIKKIVRLFVQSNGQALLPRLPFQDIFSSAQNLTGDLTKNPKATIDPNLRSSELAMYIRKDGGIDSFRGTKDKRKIPYIQKVRNRIIEENGQSHKWNFIYPNKLYLKFISIKNIEDLQKFVEESEFCIFPTLGEARVLMCEYEKVGLTKLPEFIAVQNKNLAEEMRCKEEELIFRINLKYIWDKKIEFENIVKRYADKSLEYHKLLWVNKNMENVSDSFFNAKHFTRNEILKGMKGIRTRDNRTINEIIGLETIQKLPIVPAYSIYGHYALCCLEFYLDIMRKNKLMICSDCTQINRIESGQHSNRKYCLPSENQDCARRVVAKNKDAERERKKGLNKA